MLAGRRDQRLRRTVDRVEDLGRRRARRATTGTPNHNITDGLDGMEAHLEILGGVGYV